MPHQFIYDSHQFRIPDDADLDAFIQTVEEVVNSGSARFVEIPNDKKPRVLIQQGLAVVVVKVSEGKGRRVAVVG